MKVSQRFCRSLRKGGREVGRKGVRERGSEGERKAGWMDLFNYASHPTRTTSLLICNPVVLARKETYKSITYLRGSTESNCNTDPGGVFLSVSLYVAIVLVPTMLMTKDINTKSASLRREVSSVVIKRTRTIQSLASIP